MKKSLFAVTIAASCASIAPHTARAQYVGAMGMNFNNGQSAIMSSMIQGMGNMAMMRSRMGGSSGPSGHDLQQSRGNRAIKSGRGSVLFAVRPFPLEMYVAQHPESERAGERAELIAQSALWRDEAEKRGAQFGNMADMSALAVVLSLEALTGRVNNAGFQFMARSYDGSLLKSSTFQGATSQRKQEVYEERMMASTYALYLVREGRKNGDAAMIAKGRAEAREYLEGVWQGKTDANIKVFARYSGPDNSNKAPAKAMISSARAGQSVRFVAGAPILPAKLAAQEKPEARDEARKTYGALLAAGRGQVRQLFKSSQGDNVAQAMTYAVITFYAAAKTDSGNISEAGFTPGNVRRLEQQFTLLLAGDAGFRARSARQKQQMFESAVLMGAYVGTLNAQARGDAKAREQVRAVASQAMRNLIGKTPDQVRLTQAGFEF